MNTPSVKDSKVSRSNAPARPAPSWSQVLNPAIFWPLVTGLAVGFVVGRETGTSSSPAFAVVEPAAAVAPPAAPTPAAPPAAAPAVRGGKLELSSLNPRKGAKVSRVTLVEISDFQCPFCAKVGPTMKELETRYAKDVSFVFVNQPLSFHPNAVPAAKAALAAHRQGKFWEFHDKLFANQQALSPADFEKYAGELKLNLARFKKDLADPQLDQQIAADQKLAASVDATGTPSFLINGRKLVGAKPVEAFAAVIDEEIKKANDLIATGTPLAQVSAKLTEAAGPVGAAAAAAPPEKVEIAVGNAPAGAPVTIVAFSDFQCPFCAKVPPTLKQLEEDYKGKVRVAFKQLPLSFHDKAQLAAEASLAAHEQGRFWAFHDKLFANQQALDRQALEKYAGELDMDMKKFRAALDTGKFRDQVQKDGREAASVGATGTPTFFINGQRLVGAQPIESFKKVIDEALKRRNT
jgi:protein-disulfide isomerase